MSNKRVFMRVDFNVPLEDGRITDDNRITASLPSITYVLDKGGALILASHLGRPKGKPEPKYSLKPVAARLSELLGKPVQFAPDCVGPEVQKMASALKPGEVLMLVRKSLVANNQKHVLPHVDAAIRHIRAALKIN